ncbi:hypothetical protein JF634_00335 [Simonsiella muelleri]|uniref:hypothetical protein n=1 Tax=Simonsiella muelleri TaxID=72 RepID=UPI000307B2E3|nr:hypothetical protein [Simonsiella muelleri]UBQ54009.1 hypothetical protein JF634_00335 [Simonsiella muelleri]
MFRTCIHSQSEWIVVPVGANSTHRACQMVEKDIALSREYRFLTICSGSLKT